LQPANAKEELKIMDFQIQQTNLPAEDDVQTITDVPVDGSKSAATEEQNICPVNNINRASELPTYLKQNQDNNSEDDTDNQSSEPNQQQN
jgi:hypothetical protein